MEDQGINKMKTYAVERIVYIGAKSAEEIVLDWGDYQDTTMEVVEDDN